MRFFYIIRAPKACGRPCRRMSQASGAFRAESDCTSEPWDAVSDAVRK
ncbi:MAG: hypothetical protein J1F14_08270 [Treponema sp.]|nr:hypothetical protein [Treponema sp.]